MESENIEIQQAVKLKETGKKRADAVKLQRGDNAARKKRKQMELPSPATDRPIRERKSIERLIVSPQKEVKEFKILKGTGTPLKNIPNVVFKLSKLKGSDEAVQTLHRVIFGRVSSKYTAKANILQFSGFVWNENEEKERIKVKERLDKVVKEILAKISDILDLNLQKGLKKEDSVIKVLEFLKSPYKTTDELIEEKIKLVKMKKALKKSLKSTKKRRSTAEKSPKKKTPKKKKDTDEEGVDNTADDEDEMNEEPEERYEDKGDDYYDDSSSKKKKRKRASREVKSDEPSPKKGKGQKKRGSNKKAPKGKTLSISVHNNQKL
ncbi:hypothetical protein KP509_04G057400 [Ceratopteris richardii]|uniref:Protein DEK n=1 Tax=Ceratopteris richardii TaxID=49495 RepID=A0A8T2V518_CERRI|nr:hypothetical protein KP509_04G057400 [Ceratopteris richardii]